MVIKKLGLLLGLALMLSGCFEWIEDISFNADGSGTYKATLNLSSSKMRIKSILSLDSLNGKPIPSLDDIHHEMDRWSEKLEQHNSINKVSYTIDRAELILKLSIHFSKFSDFQEVIINELNTSNREELIQLKDWMRFDGKTFTRKRLEELPDDFYKKWQKDEDFNKLEEAKCVFIHRFPHEIVDVDNPQLKIAKNGKNTMVQLLPLDLIKNPSQLSYTINF